MEGSQRAGFGERDGNSRLSEDAVRGKARSEIEDHFDIARDLAMLAR